jgi:hypothetical protein
MSGQDCKKGLSALIEIELPAVRMISRLIRAKYTAVSPDAATKNWSRSWSVLMEIARSGLTGEKMDQD